MENEPILLVEDDPNDVLLLQRAFRKEQLANPLHVVGDGEQAVAYPSGDGIHADRDAHPLPALVLLDLELRRLSGHEVLAWPRAQPGIGRVRVTVLTPSRESADVNRASELGENAYPAKPVDTAELCGTVRSVDSFWLEHGERPDLA